MIDPNERLEMVESVRESLRQLDEKIAQGEVEVPISRVREITATFLTAVEALSEMVAQAEAALILATSNPIEVDLLIAGDPGPESFPTEEDIARAMEDCCGE